MIRPAFNPALLCLPLVAACAASQDDGYPRLLPLDELVAPPALPAHAADAVASPNIVAAELRARAAATEGRAAAAAGPVTDSAALQSRAAALRNRAQTLRTQDPTAPDPPTCGPEDPDCAQP